MTLKIKHFHWKDHSIPAVAVERCRGGHAWGMPVLPGVCPTIWILGNVCQQILAHGLQSLAISCRRPSLKQLRYQFRSKVSIHRKVDHFFDSYIVRNTSQLQVRVTCPELCALTHSHFLTDPRALQLPLLRLLWHLPNQCSKSNALTDFIAVLFLSKYKLLVTLLY